MEASTQPSAAPATASTASPAAAEIEPAVVANDPNPIVAADNDDHDSLADTESVTTESTASLAESITEYRRIHGRTYTQKADYWGPNDEQQNEGLDLAHYWETLLLGDKLFLSPLGDGPLKVLDLGTGTGIWAIDFADEFPSSEVTGVDISPIQPGWVPPNCKFQIDDVEQPWTWTPDFDFIHLRHMEACISDWPAFYKQIYDHLKPGGYFEMKDFDIEFRSQAYGDSLPEDHVYRRWGKIFFEAANRLGKSMDQSRGGHKIADAMRDAGFVDVVEKSWPVPIGGWPKDPTLKEVGTCNLEFHDQSLEGFSMFLLTQVMDWDSISAGVFVAEARKALKDPKLQTVIYLQNVYGRKPEGSS
ncbi:UMTA protein [Colletotrichum scovillei]|uniref:UMTA protein n=1 Tax=Colletotrichum scovillei TaxID=1209932 RepID=A0A9P7UBJ0_9PEZI|nr:UMTA protein [Colletotrichum scovillei]KAF4773906.1 UMTA protein [Colletotrichum scovillei]KAG7048311.1 UMTA protein [Colletotrichum scovillei]KAG7065477.1 UMTA protein [Colletotrichum scovillei]KAG7068082.1 UMTA protein [Colletotrichum scovillei]